ncbi:MAG TPA: shikimate kinase [Pyrinomonadaceae bacterium]|jgi:shikimate kinase|nr:shikimate kinase [Pyrinomonadaceae bacterium]
MMDESRKILITGFMGAGKTTVAEALGRALGREVIDLDLFINEREGASPQELIDAEGEMRFREKETLALGEVLAGDAPSIISLGGGTWTVGQNRALIAEHNGFVVWLDAPFELCWRRIAGTLKTRPLARDKEEARRRYEDRRPLYQLAALHVAVTELKRADATAAEIAVTWRELEAETPLDEPTFPDRAE